MADKSDDLESKIMAHTFAIQQDYIKGEPITHILNSILEAIMLITKSSYGFIARVTDKYFIPIATSGIRIEEHSLDNKLSLMENFNLFMKKSTESNIYQMVKFISISDDDVIGLISSDKLHILDNEQILEPLIIVCRETLKKYNEIKKVEIEKGSIISYIGHELRTPLTNMIGSIILLKESTNEKIRQEYLKIIEQSNSEFVSIVNDTIDYSKLLLDKIKLNTSSSILKDIITDVIQILDGQMQQKKIKCRYNISNDVPKNIKIDSIRFKQLLINVISSVLGLLSTKDKIKLIAHREKKYLLVTIKINTSSKNKNKDIYKQLLDKLKPRDTEKIYAGIDLRLRIANKLIDLFNGTISVNEDPLITIKVKLNMDLNEERINLDNIFKNRDCIILSNNTKLRIALYICLKKLKINCFSFSTIEETDYFIEQSDKFLLFTDNDHFDGKSNEIIKTNEWAIYDIKTTDLVVDKIYKKFSIYKPDINILVVEDNETNRRIITGFLNMLGWTNYNEAIDGSDGLKKIKAKHYDIIFMDINMPIMDGKQATMNIHKMYDKSSIKKPYIIALTANDDYVDFYREKMNDFILKPITNIKVLENVLQKYVLSDR